MRAARVILIGLAGLSLSGCNQYFERKDSIGLSAGDAVASNAAVQIPDPWPRRAFNTNIRSDGRRANLAYERYATGAVGSPPAGPPGQNAPADIPPPTPFTGK